MKANYEKNLKRIATLQNGCFKYTWSTEVHSYQELYKSLDIWDFKLPTASLIEAWKTSSRKPFYEGWCPIYNDEELYVDVYLKTIPGENLTWFEMSAYLDQTGE